MGLLSNLIIFLLISVYSLIIITVGGIKSTEIQNLSSTYKCNFLGADNKQ